MRRYRLNERMTLTQQIVSALGPGATSGEIALRLGRDINGISSILSMKCRAGVVEVVGTRVVNKNLEHIYRMTGRPDAWPQGRVHKVEPVREIASVGVRAGRRTIPSYAWNLGRLL